MGFKLLTDNHTCEAQPRATLNLSTNNDYDDSGQIDQDYTGDYTKNASKMFAMRGNQTPLLYTHVFPVVGVTSCLVVLVVLLAVAVFCRKCIRKSEVESEHVYCIPNAPVPEHVYAVPVPLDMTKRPQVVIGEKDKELAFENPSYDFFNNDYEDIVVSAYDYPKPKFGSG